MRLTSEQDAAINSKGKVIVSASAGSGKTFVMIEKLVNAVIAGVDLDDVLAVTFTKKAAAQMKEKLRKKIIERLETADGEEKIRLKAQLTKVPSANISTIHSFCGKLLRTYFYALGIDSGFEIISADDAEALEYKNRALDNLFERMYDEDNGEFKHLLKCYMRKRNDQSLRKIVLEAYKDVRSVARYEEILKNTPKLYTEQGFKDVCVAYRESQRDMYNLLISSLQRFREGFYVTKKQEVFEKIFLEMEVALTASRESMPYDGKLSLTVTKKPILGEDDREADEAFKTFRDRLKKRYDNLHCEFGDEETERKKFFECGKTATAFSNLVLAFDREYAAVKAEENKLDYNDLEHLTLKLLSDEDIKREINESFKYAFVDEYQDVNPVQEEILSALTGESFVVGDVKQAIYGFRGSKSKFFSEKYARYESGAGSALRLSSNFRSSDAVLDFVNAAFSDIMRPDTCGIDYKNKSQMLKGGLYPEGYGYAGIHIIGEEEEEERGELNVYSVKNDVRKTRLTREGRAVVSIIEREVNSQHYDLNAKDLVNTGYGDICILTRKNKGYSNEGIVQALKAAGIPVAGAQEENICNLAEVKEMLDILSLIDNAEQDIPLVTALLSPLGGFDENELALIRIKGDEKRTDGERKTFKSCCEEYSLLNDEIAQKLNIFWGQLEKLRSLAEILSTGELIDELLENYSLEVSYGADGDDKVKNVLRLAAEGANLPLQAFLEKIKAGGYEISAPAPAPSDSVKIMTMHASKGLEFPVVIIADICRTFAGIENGEMPFDEDYGFAPRFFDFENMLVSRPILRQLVKIRTNAEELKNELNLFYVACTRAMCNLHILAGEESDYDETAAYTAKCYADLIDFSKFSPEPIEILQLENKSCERTAFIFKPDEKLVEDIGKTFMAKYANAESVNLPVKSSASAILKMQEEEPHFKTRELFGGEGETNTEIGTAYHRFLELCDFSKKSVGEIVAEMEEFKRAGEITEAQFNLLSAEELAEILAMPAFSDLVGAKLMREQEFLCRLPANELFDTKATDPVLIQGAIDLYAEGGFGVKIIDYKYSHKSDEELIRTYSKQLDLYKKAVATITGEEKIEKIIINIHLKRQINLI